MNSLNIITTRVSPSSTPAPSRSNSLSNIGIGITQNDNEPAEHGTEPHPRPNSMESYSQTSLSEAHYDEKSTTNEETPLLSESKEGNVRASWWHRIPRGFATSIISSIRWVFATITSPGVYLIACFYDSDGYFLPWVQLKGLFGLGKGEKDRLTPKSYNDNEQIHTSRGESKRHSTASRPTLSPASSSSSPSISSDSENDESSARSNRHTRSKSLETDESNPTRKSIRIKLNNDEALEKRKHRKTQSAVARTKASDLGGDELSAHLKSPTSPIAALTKYPRTPAPPRPLIPRRQPSYINFEPSRRPQKTLILDLDETLIHSMSKGGRMNTGHMVEVRLSAASLGIRGGGQVGQHPILYWVNKRPYCDDFLRRVSKWFNLVVFTASVQEYADPVIDWLEQERKYFSARYYRQHCTYRQGAYIKDLSSVEPDLSNVMILDNSPLSYLFHEDNAIPIQGWINDPTDYDLMNIVPLLEGLQYVHDVRALLALRGGEEGRNAT